MNVTASNISADSGFACSKQKWWCNEEFNSGIRTTDTLIIIANVLLSGTAVLGNGLIFYVYYKNESLRNPANKILLSLAVTDFLTGVVSHPIFIYERLLILTNCTEQICAILYIRSLVILFLSGATQFNLSVTTLDRYIAIFYSLRYPDIVTNERVTAVLSISWLLWIGCMAFTLTSYLHVWLLATVGVIVNVTFISTLNFRIFREMRRLSAAVVAPGNAEQARKARERKGVETLAIILGLLFLSYVPIILFLIALVFMATNDKTIQNEVLIQKLYIITLTFAFSNSSLNVLVYFWKNTEIRLAIQKVFRPLTQRVRIAVIPVGQESAQERT